jgi:hypothetical protein
MPQRKKKYLNPVVPISAPAPVAIAPDPIPFAFDLKGAARYSGFSVWALRQAIYSKTLPVVNAKPYVIRRVDLENFINKRVGVAA